MTECLLPLLDMAKLCIGSARERALGGDLTKTWSGSVLSVGRGDFMFEPTLPDVEVMLCDLNLPVTLG